MKVKLILFLAMLSFLTYATPNWMDIGTYSIADGPCQSNSLFGIPYAANKFYTYAVNYRPDGGPNPSRVFAYEDLFETPKSVTVASCNNSSYPASYCDFIWMASHGNIRSLQVWNAAGSGCDNLTPSQMVFGSNGSYTRWVYIGGCHVLKYDGLQFWSDWNSAFQGVQVIIGFYSVGFPMPSEVWNVFWKKWTGNKGQEPSENFWGAWMYAVYEGIYEGGGPDVAPALIYTRNTSGTHDYYTDTYQTATSERAQNGACGLIWTKWGDPQ